LSVLGREGRAETVARRKQRVSANEPRGRDGDETPLGAAIRLPDRPTAEAMLRAMHDHSIDEEISQVAALIHEHAEMRLLVSHGGLLSGRAAIVAALETGWEAATFRAHVDRFEWLDEHTALSFARARYALGGGGLAEGKVVWLDELRDGLIWRVQVFKNEADALHAYLDRQATI
jgi:hypothetical protein